MPIFLPVNPFQPQPQLPPNLPIPDNKRLPTLPQMQVGNQLLDAYIMNRPWQDQPIPEGLPGGESVYTAQKLADHLFRVPLGAAAAGNDVFGAGLDAVQGFKNFWGGTGFKDPRLQPVTPLPSPDLTAMPQLGAQPADAGGGFPMGLPSLDGTTIIPGPPIPQAQKFNPQFPVPDFTAANARLEAARPQPRPPKGDSLGSYLEGAALAAGKIDPTQHWATSLGQVLSGAVAGGREFRAKQEEAELRDETLQRQYELMRAGVEESRATAEAQAAYNRIKIQMDATQQNFENDWKTFAAKQPSINANADGSMVITSRGENGNISVQRLGFMDALKHNLALAQAKGLGGKEAENSMFNNILKTSGPAVGMSVLLTQFIGKGVEQILLPPGAAQDTYRAKIAEAEQELIAAGHSGTTFKTLLDNKKWEILSGLVFQQPIVGRYAMDMLLGKDSSAPTAPSKEVPASQGGFFQSPNLLGTK